MSNADGDWSNLLWEGVKYFLAGLGTVASSFAIWIAARYRGDRAMLLRHEKQLEADDEELGKQKAFREKANKGFVGLELKEEFKKRDEKDSTLGRRITKNKTMVGDVVERLARLETKIDLIYDEMQQRRKDKE